MGEVNRLEGEKASPERHKKSTDNGQQSTDFGYAKKRTVWDSIVLLFFLLCKHTA